MKKRDLIFEIWNKIKFFIYINKKCKKEDIVSLDFLKRVVFFNFLGQNVKVLYNFIYWLLKALFQLEIAHIGSYINETVKKKKKRKYRKIVLNS